MEERDAVIVGARCAGSTLAISLAQRGWNVLVVDRDTFPSDTVSTHMMFPNTLARFEQLGVLDTLRDGHHLSPLAWRVIGLGHEFAGTFTPIDGFDRCLSVRRITLDNALVDTAMAAGAEGRFGKRVVDLIGSGTEHDPVRGVALDDGEEIPAKWVVGADGRGSTVAGKLGLEKDRPQRGEIAFMWAYWSGIPDDGFATTDIQEDAILIRWAVEDGLTMLTATGPDEFTHGSKGDRHRNYRDVLGRFPDSIPPAQLKAGEMISDLVVAPEPLMRGFFRKPTGPGWALIGDACHFKHPGTAQGIADAVEQAIYVAENLSGPDRTLDGYEEWRDARAAEHYDWSFDWGRFPRPPLSEKIFRGWASDPDAGQDVRDTLTRRVEPSRAMSKDRMERWLADAPLEAGAYRSTAAMPSGA
jgi:2-polyprenyl-6-methoxyphenol hydroxylase-like FAD-dependent oxidoreductase